jgi:hypothetical protein
VWVRGREIGRYLRLLRTDQMRCAPQLPERRRQPLLVPGEFIAMPMGKLPLAILSPVDLGDAQCVRPWFAVNRDRVVLVRDRVREVAACARRDQLDVMRSGVRKTPGEIPEELAHVLPSGIGQPRAKYCHGVIS